MSGDVVPEEDPPKIFGLLLSKENSKQPDVHRDDHYNVQIPSRIAIIRCKYDQIRASDTQQPDNQLSAA